MRQLDLTVLHAVDLDVPQNILQFSVLKPPQHGSIINHRRRELINKKRNADLLSLVVEFTMTELINGTFST